MYVCICICKSWFPDHHALMDVWHGQTVREDRVGEYVKFTYKIL